MVRTPKADRQAVVEHYRESGSMTNTAAAFGINPQTVSNYCKALGEPVRARGGVRRYQLNEAFFESYTPASCYWAGFLGADGSLVLHGTARVIQVMLALGDHAHLEAFTRCAGSTHPVKDVLVAGTLEAQLRVSSKRWWDGLVELFGLHQRKSFTLLPPSMGPGPLVYHFIRGYFDGDGTVEGGRDSLGRPKQVSMVSGSRPFLEWVRRSLGSHHHIGPHYRAWRLAISGPVLRREVPLLYAGSTPDTRLGRKYELLKCYLDNASTPQ